ncbi:MAG: type II toxin-antitoxin system RelE/ParE family toxin [Thermodesulfobacteriota bacterium]
MKRLRFSPTASRDLDQIFDHIANDNPSAAQRFIQKLKQACERIARLPGIGAPREDLAPGLRCFPVANYLIFYRIRDNKTEIARVLHAARDYLNLMI